MSKYSKETLLEKLSPLTQRERKEVLYQGNNRDLVRAYGGNITFYHGDVLLGNSFQEKFKNINLTVIQRLKNGRPNGIGAFGGRTEDVDMHGDLSEIANRQTAIDVTRNTAKRELAEELGELGINVSELKITRKKMRLVDLPAKDDLYIIDKWNGIIPTNVTAVDPFSYIYELETPDAFDTVKLGSENKTEVANLVKINLFEALQRCGKTSDHDTRDVSADYHYPHEYFTVWKIASDVLGEIAFKPRAMAKLAAQVQAAIYEKGHDYRINFDRLAHMMDVLPRDMNNALGVPKNTVEQMQDAINAVSKQSALGV